MRPVPDVCLLDPDGDIARYLRAVGRPRLHEDRKVVCFDHVTNQMGQVEGDFEKGAADGAAASLALIMQAARRLGF